MAQRQMTKMSKVDKRPLWLRALEERRRNSGVVYCVG
jgi:hypothetical protein